MEELGKIINNKRLTEKEREDKDERKVTKLRCGTEIRNFKTSLGNRIGKVNK